jgi:hypothetical protein
MSTALTERIASVAPRSKGRAAGFSWLMTILTGSFAMLVAGRVAGLGWLTLSLTSLLSPPLARSLSIDTMAAGGLGEGSLTLWLLAMGVNVQRWNEQASAAAP